MTQATAEKMKAVAIGRFGNLDELKLYDLPKPKPAADEVLIRIRAAGVGIWDSKQREGATFGAEHPAFPMILGVECAGDIERLGSNVTGLRENEAVYTYFYGKQGAYAQYAAVKAEYVARKPKSLSYVQAAAVPVVAITAHQALVDEIALEPGETLFVAGAAGGVGTMAVQIASALGARVIASARSDDFAYLESLGVLHADLIDYQQSDVVRAVRDLTKGKGADAALDTVGGEHAKETIRGVKDGGRLAVLTDPEPVGERNVNVLHVQSKPSAKRLDKLRDMFEAGQLKVHVIGDFPLADAREAQKTVEQRHAPGEIVINVD